MILNSYTLGTCKSAIFIFFSKYIDFNYLNSPDQVLQFQLCNNWPLNESHTQGHTPTHRRLHHIVTYSV